MSSAPRTLETPVAAGRWNRGNPTSGDTSSVLRVALLALACLAPPDGPAAPADPRRGEGITLQLKWYHQFQFAGYYAAQAKGFYAGEGLRVTILEGGRQRDPVRIVLDGDAHFGVGDSGVVLGRIQGKPIVACAAIFQHSPYVILSRRDRNITTPSALVGQRVMLADDQGASQLKAMLTREGISPGLIEVSPHSWDLSDLIEGRVDAVSAYAMVEPDLLRQQGVDPAMLRAVDYGVDFYGDTLFTTEREIRNRPRTVAAFVRASLRGWEYAMEHPEEIAGIILGLEGVASRGLTRELILRQAEGMRPYILPDVVPLGHMNQGRWEHIAATFASQGMAPGTNNLKGFLFDPNPAPDPAAHRRLLLLGAGSLCLTGLVLLWNGQIRRLVRQRTRELRAEIARRQETEDGLKRALEERIRTEERLRASEEQFRLLFRHCPVPLAIASISGKITLLNQQFTRLLGYHLEDLPTIEAWWNRAYPDPGHRETMRQRWNRDIRTALASNAPIGPEECHITCRSGEVRIMEASGTIMGDQFLVAFFDITERQRAEAKLDLQSAALNAAANAIVIADDHGRIVFANAAFSRLTGYTTEDITGNTLNLLNPGAQPADFHARLWQTIQGGTFWQGELQSRRKDGTLYDEEMTLTPVRSSGGPITHFIAIKQDVTQRKMLERQLLRSQRMESVGLLAGGIAHDLNNVLAPVMMSIGLLRTSDLPESLSDVVDIVESSVRRGADIVKQVLTFARGIEGARGPLQLRHLVREVMRMATETFPRNIEIRSQLAPDCWTIRGDATQVHQVLLNLSLNARDAMPAGGSITYSLQNVTLDAASARLHSELREGPHVRLDVADTGTGIAPEHLDRIFEPFFTTKEQGHGTGLGLATVIGIIRGHNGAITVESVPGNGTRFSILFPAQPGEAIPESSEDQALPRGHGQLILLVDDEPGILAMADAILRQHGYRTASARNGVEALTVLSERNGEVAAVISDIMMPAMGGVALMAELKRQSPGLACIASSGLMGASDPLRTAELQASGFSGLLFKPFSAETLLKTLDATLHRSRVDREPQIPSECPSAPHLR